jgi:F0F1-type ATP synthase membrane subunit b/b'
MTQQQIQNNLAAAKQERANIRQLEQELKQSTDKTQQQVLRYRIKICKDFLRQYMLTAQSLERQLETQ